MEHRRIPNRLKKYRRLAGLSQKEVAHVLGLLNSSSISRWEKGVSIPGLATLFQLSLLYKTLPNHLYQDLWQLAKDEIAEKEKNLLSLRDAIIPNETFLL